jgi:hypothetical protein
MADHDTRPHTNNMHAEGHSPHPATFLGEPDGVRHVNSDTAFWGRLAFHGNYDGFRIIDISDPDDPQEILHQRCNGDQGDIVVWDDVLVRSWNSKKTTPRRTCPTTGSSSTATSRAAGCTGGDPAGDFIDVIEVPLGDPAGSSLLRREPLAGHGRRHRLSRHGRHPR